jgi:hypothetical protein
MHAMLSTTLSPILSLLVLLGFAGLVGLLFLIVKVVSLKMGGWKQIAEHFPMRATHLMGVTYERQNGIVGNIGSGGFGSGGRGFFDIQIAQEGVGIRPRFARHNPCLIPWSAIRRVSVSDTSLSVVVAYEQTFEFFLPLEALPSFQAKLSSQLFHKAVSPFAATKNILKDGTESRRMSMIGSQAIRFAEKQYEKEKRLRGEDSTG